MNIKGFLVCIVILVLSSCSSRLNKTNFDRISPGMTLREVIAILGEPSSRTTIIIGSTLGTSVHWENRNGSLKIVFFNDRAKIKQFTEGVSTPREE